VVLSPLSEFYGRRKVYLISYVLFLGKVAWGGTGELQSLAYFELFRQY
jgi:hypothetical protein